MSARSSDASSLSPSLPSAPPRIALVAASPRLLLMQLEIAQRGQIPIPIPASLRSFASVAISGFGIDIGIGIGIGREIHLFLELRHVTFHFQFSCHLLFFLLLFLLRDLSASSSSCKLRSATFIL